LKIFPKPFGLYPILDLDHCKMKSIHPKSLIELWNSYPDYIPFFQFRAKSIPEKEYSEIYFSLMKLSVKLKIIVNDFWKFAIRENAFGFHLGKEDFETLSESEKELVKSSTLVKGTSSHSLTDLQNLTRINWDYSGIGPIFPTNTKSSEHPVLGVDFLKQARKFTEISLAPIGGISEINIESIFQSGNFFPASISAYSDEKRFRKCIAIFEKYLVPVESQSHNVKL